VQIHRGSNWLKSIAARGFDARLRGRLQADRVALDLSFGRSRAPTRRGRPSGTRESRTYYSAINRIIACDFQHDKTPGRWRTGPIGVTSADGRTLYQAPDADQVPLLMAEVVDWLESGDLDAHVVVRAAMAHLHVVSVHPFRDGNGRISRITQSLVLTREGLLSPEFASIEEYLGERTPDSSVAPTAPAIAKRLISPQRQQPTISGDSSTQDCWPNKDEARTPGTTQAGASENRFGGALRKSRRTRPRRLRVRPEQPNNRFSRAGRSRIRQQGCAHRGGGQPAKDGFAGCSQFATVPSRRSSTASAKRAATDRFLVGVSASGTIPEGWRRHTRGRRSAH